MVSKYHIVQWVTHRLFGYRGVIFDVDPCFQGTDEWYEQVARTRPPRDKPWYRVLVDGGATETYVAERNLAPDESREPIHHPLVDSLFESFGDGVYHMARSMN